MKVAMPKDGVRLFDIIAVVLLLAVAVLPLVLMRSGGASSDAEVVISADGDITRYPLSQDGEIGIVSKGISYVISVDGGMVSVASADCPDHVCVSTGKISNPSASIVCVPGHLIVTISDEGGGGDDSDIIAGR